MKRPGEGPIVMTKGEWTRFLIVLDSGYVKRLFGVALFNALCPLTGEEPIA